jgi:hypothetical protein
MSAVTPVSKLFSFQFKNLHQASAIMDKNDLEEDKGARASAFISFIYFIIIGSAAITIVFNQILRAGA